VPQNRETYVASETPAAAADSSAQLCRSTSSRIASRANDRTDARWSPRCAALRRYSGGLLCKGLPAWVLSDKYGVRPLRRARLSFAAIARLLLDCGGRVMHVTCSGIHWS
jgi:hypothetical protein